MKRILIIPTAGLATRLSPLNIYYPKVLVPLGDEPILAHILSLYAAITLDKVIIVVGREDKQRFENIKNTYQSRYPISVITQSSPSGPLPAIAEALEELLQADEVCVHLADTLLHKPFKEKDFADNFILTSTVSDTANWAMVARSEAHELLDVINKPAQSQLTEAAIGVYFFKHARLLHQTIQSTKGQVEISVALLKYNEQDTILTKLRNDWQDIGDIRHFHTIQESFATYKPVEITRQQNIIVKRAKASEIEREQYFYRHAHAKQLFPRLLDSSTYKLKLSYQPLRSLAYYALFENVSSSSATHILASLLNTLDQNFYQVKVHWNGGKEQTEWMYGQRVVDIVKKDAEELSTVRYWLVNNIQIKGFPELEELILAKAKALAKTLIIKHIHGDLHLANILYDPVSNTFTFVDPRGMWGKQLSIYGDLRYDLAKLLHSLHGGYEFIKRGISLFEQRGYNAYLIQSPEDTWQTITNLDFLITKYKVQLDDVLWIEALCFLSMVRCYTDLNLKKKFFLQGLHLINKLL